jgi:hypothetical protein
MEEHLQSFLVRSGSECHIFHILSYYLSLVSLRDRYRFYPLSVKPIYLPLLFSIALYNNDRRNLSKIENKMLHVHIN